MCGIIGYVGLDDAKKELLKGLQALEYRGYDSAGIAYCQPNGIQVSQHLKKLQEPLKISILGAFPTIQTRLFLTNFV